MFDKKLRSTLIRTFIVIKVDRYVALLTLGLFNSNARTSSQFHFKAFLIDFMHLIEKKKNHMSYF